MAEKYWKVIFYDCGDIEVESVESFKSAKLADDFGEETRWEDWDYRFNRDGEEEYSSIDKYFNSDDEENYVGYFIREYN